MHVLAVLTSFIAVPLIAVVVEEVAPVIDTSNTTWIFNKRAYK